jgi:hypothetical protein
MRKGAPVAFKNRFGWSVSRERLLDECPRKYYFHYYLSWGGWERKAPLISREAFKLKRLVSLSLWRGQLVHYVVSKVLQSMKAKGRVPEKQKVIDYAVERFEAQLEFSRSRRYLTESKKRGNRINIDWLALVEHEYDRPIDRARLERTRLECVEGIEGLYSSPLLPRIERSDPSGWSIEDLDHAEFSQVFEIGGVTVYAKTDFMFREADSSFNIVDWKTNRPTGNGEDPAAESNRIQLGIYGYFATAVLSEPIERLRLLEVNLLEGGLVKEHSIDEDSLRSFADAVESGIGKLSDLLVDSDVARNEPLGPTRFPKIENGRCIFCNFFRICKDETSHVLFHD